MGRIRTIKPEFPHSESMGRVSRDARLLFILLWTLCDDSGRTRGDSRMIASLLFPYDEDSRALANDREPSRTLAQWWIDELESEGCIETYRVGRDHYIQVVNWASHQKIDRPSPSKFPENPKHSTNAREDSRGLDEDSRGLVLGSRIKDQGPCIKDQGPNDQTALPGAAAPPPGSDKPKRTRPRKPVDPIMIPDALASHPGFAEQWAAWEAYRRESKKTLTASTRNSQLLMLSRHGPAKAVEMLSRSITNGWTGLFPSDDAGGHRGPRRASNESGEYRGAKPLPEDQQEVPF